MAQSLGAHVFPSKGQDSTQQQQTQQTQQAEQQLGATHALLLAVATGVEGLTGLAMRRAPFIVTQLLLGGDIPSVAVELVRSGGAALLSLAIAAWPNADSTADLQPAHRRVAVLLHAFLTIRASGHHTWRKSSDGMIAARTV